jgi:hypothetical protein
MPFIAPKFFTKKNIPRFRFFPEIIDLLRHLLLIGWVGGGVADYKDEAAEEAT